MENLGVLTQLSPSKTAETHPEPRTEVVLGFQWDTQEDEREATVPGVQAVHSTRGYEQRLVSHTMQCLWVSTEQLSEIALLNSFHQSLAP